MSNPDEIRAEIAQTRSDLSSNVNALGEAVRPATWPGTRSTRSVRKGGDLKDRVMGSAQDTVDAGADAGSGLKDQAAAVPGQVKTRAQGNPLAMGLIALGAGWLIGSLMPATDREARLATAAKDQAQPLVDTVQSAAEESVEHLKESAKDAAQSVTARAKTPKQTSRPAPDVGGGRGQPPAAPV